MSNGGKLGDCLRCICLKCISEFKLNPRLCEHSDCEWCENELGAYIGECKVYEEKARRQEEG